MESKITVVEMYDKDILKYKKKLRYNQIVGNVGSLTFIGSIAVGLGLAIAQPSEVAWAFSAPSPCIRDLVSSIYQSQ